MGTVARRIRGRRTAALRRRGHDRLAHGRRARPRSVLLVVHALAPAELSGTPLVAHGYARVLGEAGWDVTVLSAMPGAPPWSTVVVSRAASEPFGRAVVPPDVGTGTSWLDAWAVPRAPAGDHPPGDVSADVARFLERVAPDVVHIVDNVFLPLSLPEHAHDMGIPVVRSVSCAEDLCALVVPVSPCSGSTGFCTPPLTVEHCASCVMHAMTDASLERFRSTGDAATDARLRAELEALLITQRARATSHFLDLYDRMIFASGQFRDYFEQTLPLDPSRTLVVPMGVDAPAGRRASRRHALERRRRDRAGPLVFLVAGNTNPFKGTGAIAAAFTHPVLREREDWRLVLAGGGNRQLYGPLLDDARVRDLGPYEPSDLARLISAADVGISASVFETFHRVTREYLAGGVPVVGSMAFGISDVVRDGENGLLFDHADADALPGALVRLLDERALVARLRAGAAATQVRRTEQEVAELVAIYEEVAAARALRRG